MCYKIKLVFLSIPVRFHLYPFLNYFCYLFRYLYQTDLLYLHKNIKHWSTMGRKKQSKVDKSPFKLRRRKLTDGRESLFIDRTVDGKHEYEFLKLYLVPENSVKAKMQKRSVRRRNSSLPRPKTWLMTRHRRKQPKTSPRCCCPTSLACWWRNTSNGNSPHICI